MPECGAPRAFGRGACRNSVAEGRCHMHREAGAAAPECPVCLAALTGPCKTLDCGHVFHRRCLLSWKNRGHHTCPMCRASFAPPPPEYRVTVTVTPLGREPRVFTANTLPDMLRNMVTPDVDMTEIFIDVNTLESLRAILGDLGVAEGAEF
jgi:Ring finger domain